MPIAAPDSVPEGLYTGPNAVLEGSPHFHLSDRVLRGVVLVVFDEGASQAERQAAIDLVSGEVIGGQRIPNIEGYYLVRVRDDGSGKQMKEAMERLEALPQVASASPEYLFDVDDLLR